MGEFGNKFRVARESKELSLDDVSNVTKISSRMLQAIEEERFDQLPGGVFNRGFIRAYAKHLGLNSEDAVTDYLACLRQAQIDAHEVWQPEPVRPEPVRPAPVRAVEAEAPIQTIVAPTLSRPAVKPQPEIAEELPDLQLPRVEDIRPPQREFRGKPSPPVPWRLIAVAAIVVILAFYLSARRSRDVHPVSAKTGPPPTVSAAPAATGAQISATTPATPAADSSSPAPAASTPAPAVPPAGKTSTPARSSPKSQTPANGPQEQVIEKGDVTIRSFGRPLQKPADKSTASLSLVIRATETSWISVTSDGQLVTQETLIAPANTTIHAAHEIVARVGNAAGVSFLWNGQELPVQGAESEAKTFVFDGQGMREQSAPTPP